MVESDLAIIATTNWKRSDLNNIERLGDNKDRDPRTSEFSVKLKTPDGKEILGFAQITQSLDLGCGWIHIPLKSDHPFYIDIANHNARQSNDTVNPQEFTEKILGLPWKIKGYEIMCSSVTILQKEGNSELCHITVNLPTHYEPGKKYTNADRMSMLAEVFKNGTGGIVIDPIVIE